MTFLAALRPSVAGGSAQPGPGRVWAIDAARSAALLGMAVFHLTYDLELFGLVPAGTIAGAGWGWFARIIAGSFIFLAGTSLVLAHGAAIRWRAWLWRLAVIWGAAMLVTAATWLAMPERFIYFGILHSIALSGMLGLAFLRCPAVLTLLVAAAVMLLPGQLGAEMFDTRWLAWTGLAVHPPPSLDFEPVLPWFGPFLLGMAAARLGLRRGVFDLLREFRPASRMAFALAWPGRHSLTVYLLHQPVLVALVWALSAAQAWLAAS